MNIHKTVKVCAVQTVCIHIYCNYGITNSTRWICIAITTAKKCWQKTFYYYSYRLILGFFSISQLAKNMLRFFQTVTKTVLFCLFFNRKHIHCNKSLDEQLGSKYQFYLFENEGGCKSLYRSEKILVEKLLEMRIKLDKIKMQLQEFSQFQNGIMKKHFEDFFHNLIKLLQNIENTSKEFPTRRDAKGEFQNYAF